MISTFNALPIHAADWLLSRHPKMVGVLLIAAVYGAFVFERM